MPTVRRGLCSILLVILFISAARVMAQQPEPVPQAPIPAQIATAKKIFIGNAAGEDTPYSHTQSDEYLLYSGGPDRTYNQFYQAMKSWGRYELVSAPADADLVFQIRFDIPILWDKELLSGKENARTGTNAGQFRLEILDPKTHFVLWALTENVETFYLKRTANRNFDRALANLVQRVKDLVGS